MRDFFKKQSRGTRIYISLAAEDQTRPYTVKIKT